MAEKFDQIKKLESWLYQYNYVKKQIQADKKMVEELREDNLSGVSYDQEKTQSTNQFYSTTESQVLAIGNLEDRIHRLENLIKRIDAGITVLNEDEALIIKRYYIRNESWTAISYSMHISEKQCQRIRDDAIDKLQFSLFGQIQDKKTGAIQLGFDFMKV